MSRFVGHKIFLSKIKIYATKQLSNSFHECPGHNQLEFFREMEEANMDQIIRRIIRTAVESFPIDPKKKAELLNWLIKGKTHGGEHHEL